MGDSRQRKKTAANNSTSSDGSVECILGGVLLKTQYGLNCPLSQQGAVPVFRMNNYANGRMIPSDLKFADLPPDVLSDYRLGRGDILFNRTNSADLVGKVGLFDLDGTYAFASYLIRLVVDRSKVIPEFLNHLLNSPKEQSRIRLLATPGVSQCNINIESLKRLSFRIPPLATQQQNVKILDAIDAAIAATRRVLGQMRRVRKALLADLLTHGLPGRHKKFKTVKGLGRIPAEWEVVRLGDATTVLMGTSPPGDTYNDQSVGAPLLNGPTEFGPRFPTPRQWTTSPIVLCDVGDILFCVRGSSTGRQNIADRPYCIGRGLAAIRGGNLLQTELAVLHLERAADQMLHRAKGAGSTFPCITSSELKDWLITVPLESEQDRICAGFERVDASVHSIEENLASFNLIRVAVTDDLFQAGALKKARQLRREPNSGRSY